jgi:hypothetical protein
MKYEASQRVGSRNPNIGSLIHGHTIPLEGGKTNKLCVCSRVGGFSSFFSLQIHNAGPCPCPPDGGHGGAQPQPAAEAAAAAERKEKKKKRMEEKKAAHRRAVERRRLQKKEKMDKEKKKKEEQKKEVFHTFLYSFPVRPSLSLLRSQRRLKWRCGV